MGAKAIKTEISG